ncbi:MAG: DUF3108 domain-containing protein [Chitinispirillales bacterium]|jgi:hypothetical protein|nr:DUF3108 domain-containing protein [Chitinispirillales bacterium]
MCTRKHLFIPSTAALISTLVFSLATTVFSAANDDEDFKWQEASRELDAFPFTQAFVDSARKAHVGALSKQNGLRAVESERFANNETLVFEVGWTVFKAGYLILSTTHLRSRGLLRISAKAMTGNKVSAIYKVRNHEISWIDADGLYPVFFEQHVREGKKYKADNYIVYDNVADKLFLKKSDLKVFDTPKFTHDYISVMYYVRTMPLNPGDEFEASLFSRPKTYPLKFKVHAKRETVNVGGKSYNCVKVEPALVGEGRVFTKKDKMEVWVTDDENHYPVMLKSKAKIGSLNAKLIQVIK